MHQPVHDFDCPVIVYGLPEAICMCGAIPRRPIAPELREAAALYFRTQDHQNTPEEQLKRARSKIADLITEIDCLKSEHRRKIAWLEESLEWRPIEQISRDPAWSDIRDGMKNVLLGCVYRGELIWAMLATWGDAHYGYIQCASRSGWAALNMPTMAKEHGPFKHPGEWIGKSGELSPTHYRHISFQVENESDTQAVDINV